MVAPGLEKGINSFRTVPRGVSDSWGVIGAGVVLSGSALVGDPCDLENNMPAGVGLGLGPPGGGLGGGTLGGEGSTIEPPSASETRLVGSGETADDIMMKGH
jgi:hypothetical protein